jgi:hypothetical protein
MLKDAFFTSFSLIAEGGFQLSTFHIYSNIPAAPNKTGFGQVKIMKEFV